MKKILILTTVIALSFNVQAQQDQVEKALQEKYMKEHGEAGMSKLQDFMKSMTDAETRSEYNFPLMSDMLITSYKNGKEKDKMNIRYYINEVEHMFAFEGNEKGKEMMMIYDVDNSAMVMIHEEQNSYMAMNVDAFKKSGMMAGMDKNNNGMDRSKDIKCSKSGKTKTIKGYSCHQLVCVDENEDSKAEIWITKDIPVDISEAAKGTPWAMYFYGLDGMNGMAMEGSYYDNGKLEGKMEVVKVDANANHTIDLSKYNKMDMFGGGR